MMISEAQVAPRSRVSREELPEAVFAVVQNFLVLNSKGGAVLGTQPSKREPQLQICQKKVI